MTCTRFFISCACSKVTADISDFGYLVQRIYVFRLLICVTRCETAPSEYFSLRRVPLASYITTCGFTRMGIRYFLCFFELYLLYRRAPKIPKIFLRVRKFSFRVLLGHVRKKNHHAASGKLPGAFRLLD